MADLFVSYRCWHMGKRSYVFRSVVFPQEALEKFAGMAQITTLPNIRKLEDYLGDVACDDLTVLYWRRMEEAEE